MRIPIPTTVRGVVPASGLAVAVAAALLLTGCGPDGSGGSGLPGPGSTAAGSTTTSSAAAAPRAVPALVGKGLQAAQDAAQDAGFRHLTSHDAAGRVRHQVLDRDWKVCFQTPRAGAVVPVGTEVDLGAVKLDERCPSTDRKPPAEVGATMPDFTGKALSAATGALPQGAFVTSKDVSGQGRFVLVGSNWRICAQSPAPGAALTGHKVTFSVVKFGERCP